MINNQLHTPYREIEELQSYNIRFGDFERAATRKVLTIPPYDNMIMYPDFEIGGLYDTWLDASTGGATVTLSIDSTTYALTPTRCLKAVFNQTASGQVAKFKYWDDLPFASADALILYIKSGATSEDKWIIKASGTTVWEDYLATDWEEISIPLSVDVAGPLELYAPSGVALTDFAIYIDDITLNNVVLDTCEWYGEYPSFRGVSSTTPSDPIAGDIWIDTTSGSVPKIYDGSSWIALT